MRRAFAVLLAVLGVAALAICFALELSWFSGALALGCLVLAFTLSRQMRFGWVVLLLPFFARSLLAREGMTVLPSDRGVRWVNTLYPERDGAIAAAAFLQLTNGLRDEEGPRFRQIMADAYARSDSDWKPTPAIASYLGMQSPNAFDAIELGPRDARGAVIFLHGYAGNFYIYCWELAQAAPSLLTVCPSVSTRGDWWSAQGEQTFVATLKHLRERGVERVYLAGLSNGGAGASVIARKHARELAGLVLISGVRGAPAALPTLVIQGASDRMMPAAQARTYARAKNVRYHELPGGHLIFLSAHERVRPLIAAFLR